MRYRSLLEPLYEKEVTNRGLSDSVIAYRRLPISPGTQSGKCNIHFAKDAFDAIRSFGNCIAICLDIKSFFDSIDHAILKLGWQRLLSVSYLPPDHYAVFKAITSYASVDRDVLYAALGIIGIKQKPNGKKSIGFVKRPEVLLCNGRQFREIVVGEKTGVSLISSKNTSCGIPQGAPISDLLANLYMLEFDSEVASIVSEMNGKYFRYSDDILIVLPTEDPLIGTEMEEKVRNLISTFGSELEIQKEKSSIVHFRLNGDAGQECKHVPLDISLALKSCNGLEYLGFIYNGSGVYLRSSTLSNLHRKIVGSARRESILAARRYRDKGSAEILPDLVDRLTKRFWRTRDFQTVRAEYKHWTFWTYANRAATIFGPIGKPILRQIRGLKGRIHLMTARELEHAIARRK